MNQSNLFQRSCPGHPEKQVIYACYNKSCNLNRLLCINCVKLHSNHSDNLLEQQEIEQKTKQSSLSCQQLIQQLHKMFNEIQSQFKILISTLESEYIFSLQRLNTMENKQLNRYFNQLTIQSETEKYIKEQITNGLNDFKQQINKCLNNLQLEDISSKDISKQDLEKAESYYKQGNDYYDKDDYVNAIKMFDQALQINQQHLQSLYLKGNSLKMMNEYQESIKLFDKALKIDPQYKDALRSKGDSLRGMDKYQESIEWFDKALKIDPQYKQALCGKGESLRGIDKYQESIELFDKALKIDPQYKDALFGKGDSLRCLKQYNEALKHLNSALQIDSNHEPSLGSKGACLIEMGRLDEAEKCLNQAIKLNPNKEFNKNQLEILKQKRKK